LQSKHPSEWIRPELHVPEHGDGDVSRIKIFPNAAIRLQQQEPRHQPLPPCIIHPYPIQDNFTGRHSERLALTSWWNNDKRPLLSMVGLGGMGKSAVAWIWTQHDLLGFRVPGVYHDSKTKPGAPASVFRQPDGVFWWSFYEGDASFELFVARVLSY